jgi:hypothetical protein
MRWVVPWLGCVAFLYPCYWAATAIVSVLPALARSLVTGSPVLQYGVSPFGASASVAADAGARWLIWAVPAAVCAALLAAVRRWPAVTGALVGATGVAMAWPLGRQRPATGVVIVFGVALLAAGLRRLLGAAPDARYPARVAFLILVFALPLIALPLLFPQRRFAFERLLAPAAAAALLAVSVSLRWRSLPVRRPGWTAIAAGLALTIGLASGAGQAGRALQQRQRKSTSDAARAALARVPPINPAAPYAMRFFQRGLNFTAEHPAGYESTQSQETLRMLPAYGVNAIALVPYGSITTPRRFGGGWESDEGIEYLSRVAHSVGVKVMLKPQLWGRTWPADFEPPNAEARRAWFDQYAILVEHYAKLAARIHADLFCIGTELAKMTRDHAEWRRLIAIARTHYRGPITYAAIQGPEFETLAFWDALDYIGLSNYYPLPDTLDTTAVVAKVAAVQSRFKKPVVFAEAGFSSYEAPHRAPWDETPRKLAPQDQARCYEALFQAFFRQPWFDGFYWWKVGTNRYGGVSDGSHTPWGKPAMEVVKRWYTQGGR